VISRFLHFSQFLRNPSKSSEYSPKRWKINGLHFYSAVAQRRTGLHTSRVQVAKNWLPGFLCIAVQAPRQFSVLGFESPTSDFCETTKSVRPARWRSVAQSMP